MCDEDTLRDTFANNRDPYATISQFVFHKDYWDCMEKHQDGSPNPDGKALRSKAKGIMLGILYGMGAKLMSTILDVSIDECKQILDEFFKMFPKVRDFTLANEEHAKKYGYVEDYLGRRRHLPDALKQELSISAKKQVIVESSIFIDNIPNVLEIPDDELTATWNKFYKEQVLESKKFNAKKDFKERAKLAGVDVLDNGAFISKTMTQCTNARIQGSASTLTKKAMVAIFKDKEINDLGFRLLIPIHDELLGECPIENVEKVEKRLTELMIDAAKPECSVAMKCDAYSVHHWYTDEVENSIHRDYFLLVNGDKEKGIEPISHEEAFAKIKEEHEELSDDTLLAMCEERFDHLNGTL